ncbi:MAG: hypothetical protein FWF49_04475 [Oscillospiraceae bacterium]|nr:hypothetical protein [Oscillospiraceae bacterium]
MPDKKDITSNRKLAVSLFLRTAAAAFMCLFVWMALNMLFAVFTTQVTGYTLYQVAADGSRQVLSEHSADEQDFAVPDESTLPEDQQVEIHYAPMPAGAQLAMDLIVGVLGLILLAAFPYALLQERGAKDQNLVGTGHLKENKERGLLIGLYASIPAAAVYLLVVINQIVPFYHALFWFYCWTIAAFLPWLSLFFGTTPSTAVSVGALAFMGISLLYVPAVSWLSYRLGYRQKYSKSKLVYKNTRS